MQFDILVIVEIWYKCTIIIAFYWEYFGNYAFHSIQFYCPGIVLLFICYGQVWVCQLHLYGLLHHNVDQQNAVQFVHLQMK